jgi:hypothetical protein
MRLHAENPELTFGEIAQLGLSSGSIPFRENEARFKYECRQCGDDVYVNAEQHARFLTNEFKRKSYPTFIGSTSTKCGRCYS